MKFLKEKYKYIIVIVICILCSLGSTYATSYLAQSDEVDYDNMNTGIVSADVQGAIDELYSCATSSSSYATRLVNLESTYKNVIYPVGSIYISVSSTNPSTLFGGTWVAFGSGKTIVGYDADDTDFDTVEETGGAKSRTLAAANIPAHTHDYDKPNTSTNGTTITAARMPKHTHRLNGIQVTSTNGSSFLQVQNDSNVVIYKRGTSESVWAAGISYKNLTTGYRIFKAGSTDYVYTSTSTGSGTTHNHSVTLSNSTTSSYGNSSPTAVSTLDAYVVVYMWKRTA